MTISGLNRGAPKDIMNGLLMVCLVNFACQSEDLDGGRSAWAAGRALAASCANASAGLV